MDSIVSFKANHLEGPPCYVIRSMGLCLAVLSAFSHFYVKGWTFSLLPNVGR